MKRSLRMCPSLTWMGTDCPRPGSHPCWQLMTGWPSDSGTITSDNASALFTGSHSSPQEHHYICLSVSPPHPPPQTGFLCGPGCPGFHLQPMLALSSQSSPAPSSCVLGLKACATTPSAFLFEIGSCCGAPASLLLSL